MVIAKLKFYIKEINRSKHQLNALGANNPVKCWNLSETHEIIIPFLNITNAEIIVGFKHMLSFFRCHFRFFEIIWKSNENSQRITKIKWKYMVCWNCCKSMENQFEWWLALRNQNKNWFHLHQHGQQNCYIWSFFRWKVIWKHFFE